VRLKPGGPFFQKSLARPLLHPPVEARAATCRLLVWPVAAMVIGSRNVRVNRFLKQTKNPREMGISDSAGAEGKNRVYGSFIPNLKLSFKFYRP
jgi:hypothetical protein